MNNANFQGKTLEFLVPLLETLYRAKWTKIDGLGALVITPTRELAYQIFESLKQIGKYHDFSGERLNLDEGPIFAAFSKIWPLLYNLLSNSRKGSKSWSMGHFITRNFNSIFSAGLVIGGKDLHFESKRMAQCNIVICTPGRLLQHMDENPQFDASNTKVRSTTDFGPSGIMTILSFLNRQEAMNLP